MHILVNDVECKDTNWVNSTVVTCSDVPAGVGRGLGVTVIVKSVRSVPNEIFNYVGPMIHSIQYPLGDGNFGPREEAKYIVWGPPPAGGMKLLVRGAHFGPKQLEQKVRAIASGLACACARQA